MKKFLSLFTLALCVITISCANLVDDFNSSSGSIKIMLPGIEAFNSNRAAENEDPFPDNHFGLGLFKDGEVIKDQVVTATEKIEIVFDNLEAGVYELRGYARINGTGYSGEQKDIKVVIGETTETTLVLKKIPGSNPKILDFMYEEDLKDYVAWPSIDYIKAFTPGRIVRLSVSGIPDDTIDGIIECYYGELGKVTKQYNELIVNGNKAVKKTRKKGERFTDFFDLVITGTPQEDSELVYGVKYFPEALNKATSVRDVEIKWEYIDSSLPDNISTKATDKGLEVTVRKPAGVKEWKYPCIMDINGLVRIKVNSEDEVRRADEFTVIYPYVKKDSTCNFIFEAELDGRWTYLLCAVMYKGNAPDLSLDVANLEKLKESKIELNDDLSISLASSPTEEKIKNLVGIKNVQNFAGFSFFADPKCETWVDGFDSHSESLLSDMLSNGFQPNEENIYADMNIILYKIYQNKYKQFKLEMELRAKSDEYPGQYFCYPKIVSEMYPVSDIEEPETEHSGRGDFIYDSNTEVYKCYDIIDVIPNFNKGEIIKLTYSGIPNKTFNASLFYNYYGWNSDSKVQYQPREEDLLVNHHEFVAGKPFSGTAYFEITDDLEADKNASFDMWYMPDSFNEPCHFDDFTVTFESVENTPLPPYITAYNFTERGLEFTLNKNVSWNNVNIRNRESEVSIRPNNDIEDGEVKLYWPFSGELASYYFILSGFFGGIWENYEFAIVTKSFDSTFNCNLESYDKYMASRFINEDSVSSKIFRLDTTLTVEEIQNIIPDIDTASWSGDIFVGDYERNTWVGNVNVSIEKMPEYFTTGIDALTSSDCVYMGNRELLESNGKYYTSMCLFLHSTAYENQKFLMPWRQSAITVYAMKTKSTVTFETNGGSMSSPSYETILLPDGNTVYYYWYIDRGNTRTTSFVDMNLSNSYYAIVPVPTKEGKQFDGWYKDTTLTESVCYPDSFVVEDGLTLYAKWVDPCVIRFETNCSVDLDQIEVPGGNEFYVYLGNFSNDQTMSIYLNGNDSLYRIGKNETPDKYPKKEGYVLEGWYLDSGFTVGVNDMTEKFEAPENGIVTLYAKWIEE